MSLKFLFSFQSVASLALFVALATWAHGQEGNGRTTANVNLRATPSASGAVLQVLPADTILHGVDCGQADGWCSVQYQRQLGWIHADYVAAGLPDSSHLFFDNFERPDTNDGDLGPEYDLRAPYAGSFPLPRSVHGRIENGMFVAGSGQIVYAARRFNGDVRRISATVSWVPNPSFNSTAAVTGGATAALLISPNANLVQSITAHVVAHRSGVSFQKRTAEGFVTLGGIPSERIAVTNDGRPHKVEATVSPTGNWSLSFDGVTVSGSDPDVAKMGQFAAWEIYHNGDNHLDLVRFHDVGAEVATSQ